MARTEVENAKSAAVSGVRGDYRIADMLLKLETQIADTIDKIKAGRQFAPPQVAEALSDRELATLELWAGDHDEVIHHECERRQAQYEAFTRRFAPRGKTETTKETA